MDPIEPHLKNITLDTFPRNDIVVFKSSANILISGCSQSGKTYLTHDLLVFKDRLFLDPPQNVIVFYREWQKVYDSLQNHFSDRISFKTDFDPDDLKNVTDCIIVFDDFLSKVNNNFLDLFLVGAHHRRLVNVFLTQTLFFNEALKIIRRNCNYFIFMSLLDSQSVFRLMQNDISGNALDIFKTAFFKIMSRQFSHIIYDRHPKSKNILRFKFDILKPLHDHTLYYEYKIFKIYPDSYYEKSQR